MSDRQRSMPSISARILYVAPTGIFSGGERVTLEIAEKMKQRGHTVLYASLDGMIREYAEAAKVPFCPLKRFSIHEIRKVVQEFQPDVIHAMDYRASFYSLFMGKPVIAHLHNNNPWLRSINPNSIALIAVGLWAKKIVCVSDSILKEYVFHSLLQKKAVVLSNVVDVKRVIEMAGTASEEVLYDVGFVGRLAEEKQPLEFVRIVAQLRNRFCGLRAVMIGEGQMRQEVEQQIDKSGLHDCITLTGFMRNPFPLIRRCRVMIMPSVWEGFGLTAVESFALGKPVLARPVGGLKKLVSNENGALCETTEEFVMHAAELLQNTDLYECKSKQAYCSAFAYGDMDSYYSELEKIYLGVENKMHYHTKER